MREALEDYYLRALPEFVECEIIEIEELKAGWETEIFFVRFRYGEEHSRQGGEHVLRAYRGEDALYKARRERDALRRLRAGGYPVPRVFALAGDDSPLDKPFLVMERAPGATMWRPLFANPDPAEQERLLTRFCQLMLDLHRLDWRLWVDDPERYDSHNALASIDRELDFFDPWRSSYEALGFGPLMAWLRERRDTVPCLLPGVVHRDFHANNILLSADGTAMVLDWTQADISDPRVDLGWTLILVGSEVGAAWRNRILARYQDLAGHPIDEISYFEALGCFKRLLVIAAVMHGDAARLGLRPDLAGLLTQRTDAVRRLYRRVVEITGLGIPEVERLLEQA